MMPIDMMDDMIAYHEICDNPDFSPQALLQAEIEQKLHELHAVRASLEPELLRRVQEMFGMFRILLEQVRAIDPYRESRRQVENLTQSVQELKTVREGLSKALQVTENTLCELRKQNEALQATLKNLQQELQKKSAQDPFTAFLYQFGKKGCTHISNPHTKDGQYEPSRRNPGAGTSAGSPHFGR